MSGIYSALQHVFQPSNVPLSEILSPGTLGPNAKGVCVHVHLCLCVFVSVGVCVCISGISALLITFSLQSPWQ